MPKNDGKTMMRKHELIHELQDKLSLSSKTTANLLYLPEDALQEIFDKLLAFIYSRTS